MTPILTFSRDIATRGLNLTIEADSEGRCRLAITGYLRSYPSQGYSTRFDEPTLCEDGSWVAKGWRLASCD